MNEQDLSKPVSDMLALVGCKEAFELAPLKGGANNRVFEVRLKGTSLLLKAYFQQAADPRDRFGTEYAFCRFAWDHGLRCVPQPLASDPARRLALYEYVRGRPIRADEVGDAAIETALTFLSDLNRHRTDPAAQALPIASEACFSLEEHLQLVDRRVARLADLPAGDEDGRQAAALVRGRLGPAWKSVSRGARDQARRLPVAVSGELPQAERRLSPSDFGFHNVIVADDGRLRFIDFEYAGWDDHAKTVCDFFCQVAVPVPRRYLPGVTDRVVADQQDPEACRSRIALLLPVYAIKWCCIVLNEFLPADSARRRFAQRDVDEGTHRKGQIAKAHGLLDLLAAPGARA